MAPLPAQETFLLIRDFTKCRFGRLPSCRIVPNLTHTQLVNGEFRPARNNLKAITSLHADFVFEIPSSNAVMHIMYNPYTFPNVFR